jgi:hypothetical protein
MSVEQCQITDWGQQGYVDGATGQNQSVFSRYKNDCEKAGIQPNVQAYQRGWSNGIKQFCTPNGGWKAGIEGKVNLLEICTGQTNEAVFYQNYLKGFQIYETKEEIRRNDLQKYQLTNKLANAKVETEQRHLESEISRIENRQYQLKMLSLQLLMGAPK